MVGTVDETKCDQSDDLFANRTNNKGAGKPETGATKM
jgi:hypothetical protein